MRSRVLDLYEFLEHAPLLVPVDPAHNGPQVSLVEAVPVRKEKDVFLNIGSQIQQLHDLGHPGSRHVAEPGQLGIVPKRLPPQQPVKPDGKCHETGDPGDRRIVAVGRRWMECRGPLWLRTTVGVTKLAVPGARIEITVTARR
jgi:hypothetical protein